MYDGPQIQDEMRKDENDKRNNGTRLRDNIACEYEPPSIEIFYLHRRNYRSKIDRNL